MEKQMPAHLGAGMKKNWGPGGEDKLAAKAASKADAAEKAKADAAKRANPRTPRKERQRMKHMVKRATAAHVAAGGKAPAPDALKDKEDHAILKKYMDKMATMRSASTKLQALRAKKTKAKRTRFPTASNESVECPDDDVRAVLDVVESAGYEVPNDLSVEEFLEATEDLATQDATVAEGLGKALAGAGIKMLKSKTASWAANKLARAGTNALVKKMKGPTGESVEDADELMATMVEVVTSNGYEFEGTSESFDPDKFLEAAVEIAETDEDLGEDISNWLLRSTEAIRGVAEGSQTGKLPARGSAANRKFVKKSTAKKARAAAKKDPENAPSRRTSGWAD